jgi:hypothetical protein
MSMVVVYPVKCCRTCGHRQYLTRSCPFLPEKAEMSLLSEEEEAEVNAKLQRLLDKLAARLRDERTTAKERAKIAKTIADIRGEMKRKQRKWRIHCCIHYKPAKTEIIPEKQSNEVR